MYLYLDTEFNSTQLISIGLVDDLDEKTFYEEVADVNYNNASLFVLDTIVPALEGTNLKSKKQISIELTAWLSQFNEPINIVYDYPDDFKFFKSLVSSSAKPIFFIYIGDEIGYEASEAYEDYFDTAIKHHALSDARALRHAIHTLKNKHPEFDIEAYLNQIHSEYSNKSK